MGKYAKAFVAAAIAGLTALAAGLDNDVVTTAEWVTVAIATLGSFGITWAVPNTQTRQETSR